jgi:hypothetical protein
VKLSEYVLRSVEERRKHLDLSTPCEVHEQGERGEPGLLRKRKLLKLLGLKEEGFPLRKNNLCLKNLCTEGDTGGVCRCTNPKHTWVTQFHERNKAAGRLWLSLTDGFVGSVGTVALHNRAVGAAEDNRVKLTHEEHAALHVFYEEQEGKSPRGTHLKGKRLPPDHGPERVKAYLKEKGAT